MKFSCTSTVPEIIVIDPDIFKDDRGHFLECYRAQLYLDHGIPDRFVQDNLSSSKRGVVRGLHYQLGRPQGKLVWVVYGEIFDVGVDIRRGSPTFGKWVSFILSSENYRQVYFPEGFAHGFCVTSETAIVAYKCTDYYEPKEERGLRWDDPSLTIEWPVANPIISHKDSRFPLLVEVSLEDLPTFRAEG